MIQRWQTWVAPVRWLGTLNHAAIDARPLVLVLHVVVATVMTGFALRASR